MTLTLWTNELSRERREAAEVVNSRIGIANTIDSAINIAKIHAGPLP
jgi:hypothetical protein